MGALGVERPKLTGRCTDENANPGAVTESSGGIEFDVRYFSHFQGVHSGGGAFQGEEKSGYRIKKSAEKRYESSAQKKIKDNSSFQKASSP